MSICLCLSHNGFYCMPVHFVGLFDIITFTTTVAFLVHANFGVETHFGKRNDINRILYLLLLVAPRWLQQTFTSFSPSLYVLFFSCFQQKKVLVLSPMRKSWLRRTVVDILFDENHYLTWFGLSNLSIAHHSSRKTLPSFKSFNNKAAVQLAEVPW